MKVIVLGGTGFFGPHLVEALVANGHEVTLFNRGKTNPHLFPELEKLQGDRDPDKGEGINALKGRAFDACIDNSGHYPRMVKASAELLAEQGLKQYVFISSISVYPMDLFEKIGVDESMPVETIADPTVETMGQNFENYGALKALCEQAAEAAMPGRATNIRPGLIVGPGDYSDRFTYWPVRINRGGEVLVPNCPDSFVQFIDVRDLADWTVKMVEDGHVGVYNATGPKPQLTWTGFVYGCRAVTTSDARFTWVDEDFLQQNGVGPWMELPLWVPTQSRPGFSQVSADKAIAVGLTFRPLAVTAKDTLDWAAKRPDDHKPRAGLAPEKEAAVLKAWHASKPAATTRPAAG